MYVKYFTQLLAVSINQHVVAGIIAVVTVLCPEGNGELWKNCDKKKKTFVLREKKNISGNRVKSG